MHPEMASCPLIDRSFLTHPEVLAHIAAATISVNTPLHVCWYLARNKVVAIVNWRTIRL